MDWRAYTPPSSSQIESGACRNDNGCTSHPKINGDFRLGSRCTPASSERQSHRTQGRGIDADLAPDASIPKPSHQRSWATPTATADCRHLKQHRIRTQQPAEPTARPAKPPPVRCSITSLTRMPTKPFPLKHNLRKTTENRIPIGGTLVRDST